MALSRFEITINGKECIPAADFTDLSLFSGVARAVQQSYPPDFLRDGYIEVQIKQVQGGPEQKIVWVELPAVPR